MKSNDPIKAYARGFHGGVGALYGKEDEMPAPRKEVPKVVVKEPIPVPPSAPKKGYVYYCGDGRGRVKIGFSKNPWSRCKEMRCFNPDAKLLTVEQGTIELERVRQLQFSKHHLVLEWFSYDGELALFIENLEKRHDLCKRWEWDLEQAGLT